MKIIIAGSRDFTDYKLLRDKCDKLLANLNPAKIQIVSGGARGADKLGEQYAKERGYPVKIFEADWEKYDKRAGYLRNQDMAHYADALIAFWNGESKGTGHMIDLATRYGLKIKIITVK